MIIVLFSFCKQIEIKETSIENSDVVNENRIKAIEEESKLEIKDNSFNDFLFNFSSNLEFQTDRIMFPILIESITETKFIDKENWDYINFYKNEPFYPFIMLSDSNEFSKDFLNKNEIIVSEINITSENFVSYFFESIDSTWYLKKIKENEFNSLNEIISFLNFIDYFSKDSTFQIQHIEFPLKGKTLDYDNDYSIIENNKTIKEWKVLNIYKDIGNSIILSYNFTELFEEHRNIIIHFKGIETGVSVELFFNKIGNQWKLVEMNNFST